MCKWQVGLYISRTGGGTSFCVSCGIPASLLGLAPFQRWRTNCAFKGGNLLFYVVMNSCHLLKWEQIKGLHPGTLLLSVWRCPCPQGRPYQRQGASLALLNSAPICCSYIWTAREPAGLKNHRQSNWLCKPLSRSTTAWHCSALGVGEGDKPLPPHRAPVPTIHHWSTTVLQYSRKQNQVGYLINLKLILIHFKLKLILIN